MPASGKAGSWFCLGRAGPDSGSLDLRPLGNVEPAALALAVVRECRLRQFTSVRVTLDSRAGLGVLASVARRLPSVAFVLTLKGCLPDLGPAGSLPNVTSS